MKRAELLELAASLDDAEVVMLVVHALERADTTNTGWVRSGAARARGGHYKLLWVLDNAGELAEAIRSLELRGLLEGRTYALTGVPARFEFGYHVYRIKLFYRISELGERVVAAGNLLVKAELIRG